MNAIEINRARFLIVVASLAVAMLGYVSAHDWTSFGDRFARSDAGSPPAQLAGPLRLQAEIQRERLPKRLEKALGGAFGGVWFEPASGRLHVGVTSVASRRAAVAVAAGAGLGTAVVETPVRSTWAHLRSAQERLSGGLADLFAREEVKVGLAPDRNAIEVELGSAVPDSRRAEMEQAASVAAVRVEMSVAPSQKIRLLREGACNKFKSEKAYCDPSIVAGTSLLPAAGPPCTVGPAVILQDHSKPSLATETYVLTAGHCIESVGGIGVKWFSFNTGTGEPEGVPAKKEIGEAVDFLNKETDVGVIRVNKNPPGYWSNTGSTPVNPTIAPWVEAAPKPFSVFAETTPALNAKTCISGQTSGTSCGKIVGLNVEAGGLKELVEVNGATTAPGDSGAPWFSEASPGLVEGTHVGSLTGGNKVFQSLETSFAKLKTKLKLLTVTNELRHPQKFHSPQAETAVTSTADGTGKTAHHVVEAGGGTLTCASASFEGLQSGTEASQVTLTASYKECTFLGLATTVSMGGCAYTIHSSGEFDIVSKTGKNCSTEPIKWEAGKCGVEVRPQTGRETLTFNNIKPGAVSEVTMNMNVTGLTYKTSGEGCPKKGEFSDGAYKTGNTILTGAKTGGGAMVNYTWE